MGTVSNKKQKVARYGTVRDLLLADIALKRDLLTPENLGKGVAVLTEMDACGISNGLFNVLADRRLFDRAKVRDLVKGLDNVQMSCPRCRKSTSLSGLNSKDRFHCSACNSLLELAWGGPAVNLSSDDPQDLATFLEAIVLKTDDESLDVPAAATKIKKMGAFESAASVASPARPASSPRPAHPKRSKKPATHYPDPPPANETGEELQPISEKKSVVGKTNVEKIDVRRLVKNYRVDSVINSGPYGRTYQATSSEGSLKVIKVLSPERAPNEKNHDQLAAALAQWATVDPEKPSPSHTLEKKGDVALVIRSYIEEPFTSLANYEFGDGSHRLRVLQVIARDLSRVHSSGHVHGNLKPSNIFIRLNNTSGEAKFVDPALHLVVPDDNDIERWKILVNSPRFRAPEEIRGEPITSATDIYKLGWVFYTVLTGSVPFAGEARPEILRRHIEGPCPQLGKDAGAWHSLIESMTALDAGQRPQSAAEIVGLIQQIAGKKNLRLPSVTPRPGQHDSAATSEAFARPGGILRYAVGPLFLAAVLGLVGWCGYEWYKISTAIASPDRNRDVYHQVAEEAFFETRANSRAAPEKAPALWDKFRESFGDTPFDGAAAAKKRNFETSAD